MKTEDNKAPMRLIPYQGLEIVAHCFGYGALKHSDFGWQTVPNAEKLYLNAMGRHYGQYCSGILLDPDGTGLPTIAQATACGLIVTHLLRQRGAIPSKFDFANPGKSAQPF